jgi:HSP20 family protein
MKGKNNMKDLINSFFEKPVGSFLDKIFIENYWDLSTGGQTNIIENDNEYVINVSASGFNKEDLEVKIENNYLIVTGKHEEKDEKYTLKEFRNQSFKRTFKIPNNIEDGFNAKFENGILVITINKPKDSLKTSKKITIN